MSYAIKQFEEGNTYFDEDGVIRWKSSNNVPPQDCLAEFVAAGLITFNVANKSQEQKKIDDAASIAQYVEGRANMSAEQKQEEMFEMRAAFGPGEKVVNVFTGETFEL
jgi:hypothetical protein